MILAVLAASQSQDKLEQLFQQAMAADQNNEYHKVVDLFREIVTEDPENPGMMNNLGELVGAARWEFILTHSHTGRRTTKL